MRQYLRTIVLKGPTLIYAKFWIGKYAKNPEKYDRTKMQQRVANLVRKITKTLHVEYFIEGEENIPTSSNCIFMPNHESFMDALSFLENINNNISFVAKKESLKMPYVGKVITLLGGEFLDRDNLREEVKTIRKVADKLVENEDISFFIFPEGTRSKDEINREIGVFKPGTMKIAYYSKKTIVPVALYGTFRILDKRLDYKKFPVQIAYLAPITFDEYKDMTTLELSTLIRDRVNIKKTEMQKKDEILVLELNPNIAKRRK